MKLRYNFYLDTNKTVKNRKEKTIFLHIGYKNKRFLIHTGETIEPKYWDVTKQKAKHYYELATELNDTLESFKTYVRRMILEIKGDKPSIGFNELKEKVKKIINNENEHDFFNIFDKYVDTRTPSVKISFVKQHNRLKKLLQDFEEWQSEVQSKDYKILLETLNLTFFDEFYNFLVTEKQFSNNYIAKQTQKVKTFLTWAYEREYTDNDKFKKYKIPAETDTFHIALTPAETEAFRDAELNDTLSKTRDVFMFQYYTGQRIDDVLTIDINDVKGDVWHLIQGKGQKPVKVSLTEQALEILAKYDYKLSLKSSQKINEQLKEIGKLLGIDEPTTGWKTIGKQRIYMTEPRYHWITTHTARRTFVSNCSIAGIGNDVIKSFTGHGTDKMVSKYFKGDTNSIKDAVMKVFKN